MNLNFLQKIKSLSFERCFSVVLVVWDLSINFSSDLSGCCFSCHCPPPSPPFLDIDVGQFFMHSTHSPPIGPGVTLNSLLMWSHYIVHQYSFPFNSHFQFQHYSIKYSFETGAFSVCLKMLIEALFLEETPGNVFVFVFVLVFVFRFHC